MNCTGFCDDEVGSFTELVKLHMLFFMSQAKKNHNSIAIWGSLDVPLDVSKWLVSGLQPTYKWGIPWGDITNLLTFDPNFQRNIQVAIGRWLFCGISSLTAEWQGPFLFFLHWHCSTRVFRTLEGFWNKKIMSSWDAPPPSKSGKWTFIGISY